MDQSDVNHQSINQSINHSALVAEPLQG